MQTKTFGADLHDDDDDAWLRRLALSEEYLARHHPSACGGYWRWFQSENVVDLVRIRRQRTGSASKPKLLEWQR
jgi:hypothetical protein